MTESIESQPEWSDDPQLAAVIWILDVEEGLDGRTLVSAGVEAISFGPDPTDDAQILIESTPYLWDIQLEDTPDGWAVQAVTTRPWT